MGNNAFPYTNILEMSRQVDREIDLYAANAADLPKDLVVIATERAKQLRNHPELNEEGRDLADRLEGDCQE